MNSLDLSTEQYKQLVSRFTKEMRSMGFTGVSSRVIESIVRSTMLSLDFITISKELKEVLYKQ